MTDRELMQQALDALQEYVGVVVSVNDPNDWTPKVADAGEPARKAIEALRDRLAQPEPEPVAWTVRGLITDFSRDFSAYQTKTYTVPLYTAPPQRELVGLTDDDVEVIIHSAMREITNDIDTYKLSAKGVWSALVRAVESKLKEKNIG